MGKFSFYIILICCLCACGENKPGVLEKKSQEPQNRNVTTKLPVPDTIFAGMADTTISMQEGSVYLHGAIVANSRQPVYSIEVQKGQVIIATVRPVKKEGNVRINQVQQPGGSYDGPFGDSLYYEVKKSGTLRFIIGQNLMAGDPWSGDFIFHVRQKKKPNLELVP